MSAALQRSGNCLPSTSQTRVLRPVGRVRCVAVQANDGFCRDKVAVRKNVESKGKVYKLKFVGAKDEVREVECPDDQYILDAAEAAGLDLPATCRGGICGACVALVRTGSVDASDIDDITFTLEQSEIDKGMALLCMSRPTSDCTIETQCDWGYSIGMCEFKANGRFSAAPDPLMGTEWTKIKA